VGTTVPYVQSREFTRASPSRDGVRRIGVLLVALSLAGPLDGKAAAQSAARMRHPVTLPAGPSVPTEPSAPGEPESSIPRVLADALVTIARRRAPDAAPVVVVDPGTQTLYVTDGHRVLLETTVSTGVGGLSDRPGSRATPTGLLRIRSEHATVRNGVFVARRPTGRIAPVRTSPGPGLITTRILTLEGLERINGNTLSRFVYIHGTDREGTLGAPASAGCIRVGNLAVIRLARLVGPGTLVYVLDRPFAGTVPGRAQGSG